MNKKNKMVGVFAVLTAALLVSMAFPVSAHHDDKTGKVSKGDDKITYINAGLIGDNFIQCLGGTITFFPNGVGGVQVIVTNPTDEDDEIHDTGVIPVDPPIPPGDPNDIPGAGSCLGGAAFADVSATPQDIPEHWQVWAQDEVYDLVDDLTNGAVDIVPSMFARMTLGASRQDVKAGDEKDPDTDCTPSPPGTRVCNGTVTQFETQFKVLVQMSVCGKAGTTDINTAAWDQLAVEKFPDEDPPATKATLENPPDGKGAYTFTFTKAVFMNGPVFFSLDCGAGGSTIKPIYDSFVHWYNNDDNPNAGPPFTGTLPEPSVTIDGDEYGSTCNPGLPTGGFVCLFPLPIGGSKCWTEGNEVKGEDAWSEHHEVLPGIIGTIGWNYDNAKDGYPLTHNLDCLEDTGEGPWQKTERTNSGPTNVVIQGFPVEVIVHPAP